MTSYPSYFTEALQILQQISIILNFFIIMVYGFRCTQNNCKSKIKIKELPPPKCFRNNDYLFNLPEPTRDDYNTHSVIVWKPIMHISWPSHDSLWQPLGHLLPFMSWSKISYKYGDTRTDTTLSLF